MARPPQRDERGARRTDLQRARQERAAEGVGQAGREVATVGRGRQHDDGLVAKRGRERGGPPTRPVAGRLPHPHRRGDAGELPGGVRRARADEQHPPAALGHHLEPAGGEQPLAHGHQREHLAPARRGAHTAAPARSPSTTAACARRGATQSPTRSTVQPAAFRSW